MGSKKVTFNSHVKVLTETGSIHYERDWGVSPFDLTGQSENLDFIQEQFEQKFSILGYAGKEDLERLQELTMPIFQCANHSVKKVGAVEYLKLLAKDPPPPCGPVPTTNSNKSRGLTVAMLSEKQSQKHLKNGSEKRRGVLRPKDIPGRDTPEQRKTRLMARQLEPNLFQKTPHLESGLKQQQQQQQQIQEQTVKSILKVTKNTYDDVVIIDLTSIEDTGIGTEDEDEENRTKCWSWEEDSSEEEREESSEREDVASPEVSRLDTTVCRDPPSFDEHVGFTNYSIVPSRKSNGSPKPDPSASYYHQESGEELNVASARLRSKLYGHATPVTNRNSQRNHLE